MSAPRGTPAHTLAAMLLLGLMGCGGAGDGAVPAGSSAGESGAPAPAGDTASGGGSWADTTVQRTARAGQATLVDVGTGAHAGFDRFVLQFRSGRLPGFTVEYASGPVHECGSGRPVEMDSEAVLTIVLRSAAAHDDGGNSTVASRALEPGLPVLASARLTCDFEGEVAWALGATARRPFRVLTLDGPPRLVVDLERP